jgi:cytochrome c-type biogenesis protein CcmH
MKRLVGALLIVLAAHAFAIDPLPFKDRAEEQRFQHLAKELRCLVCQNQDLADSDADLAKDLRLQVFQMMRDGKTDADIKTYLVSRYNDFVLYDPPVKAGTWLLWFGPGAFVLIGAGALVAILRKRSRQWGQTRWVQTDRTARHAAGSIDSDRIDPEEDW